MLMTSLPVTLVQESFSEFESKDVAKSPVMQKTVRMSSIPQCH